MTQTTMLIDKRFRHTDERNKAMAVLRKIKLQFPDTPSGSLMYSIIAQAVRDLFTKSGRESAVKYLHSDMIHAEVCGVNPAWIKRLLKQAGVLWN